MTQEKIIEDIRLRSDELSEILGRPPKIVNRLGNSVIIILLIIIIGASSIIKYPVTLQGKVVIHQMKANRVDTFKVLGTTNIENAASLKVNQKVMIDLKAYPSKNFGKLIGIVAEIKPFTSDKFVEYEIKLANGLETNKGVKIQNQPVLTGDALIIIEENSILKSVLSR